MNSNNFNTKEAYGKIQDPKGLKSYPDSKLKIFDELLEGEPGYFADEKYDNLLKDLQANILLHHKKKYVRYYFLKFKKETDLKQFVCQIAPFLTSATNQFLQKRSGGRSPGVFNNVLTLSLTHKGYVDLGIPKKLIPAELSGSDAPSERSGFPHKPDPKNSITAQTQVILMYATDTAPQESEELAFNVSVLQKQTKGSLNSQFKYIVNNWLLSPSLPEGTDTAIKDKARNMDILFTNNDASEYLIPENWGEKQYVVASLNNQEEDVQPFVQLVYGLYFYTPPLSFLVKTDKFVDISIIRRLKKRAPQDNNGGPSTNPVVQEPVKHLKVPDDSQKTDHPALHPMASFKHQKFFSIKSGNNLGRIRKERNAQGLTKSKIQP